MEFSHRDLAIVGLCAQATANLVLATIAWKLVGGKARSFLRLWAASWVCLAMFHLAALAAVAVEWPQQPGVLQSVRTGVSVLAQIASMWQIGLIVLGVYVARGGEQPAPRTTRLLLIGTALLGVLTIAITHPLPIESQLFWRLGSRCLLGGSAFILSGILLRRSAWGKESLGPRILSAAFLLCGVSLLHGFVHHVLVVTDVSVGSYFAWTTFSDLLVQMLAGFGILLWVVEEETLAKHTMAQQLQERDNQLNESQKMEALGRLAGGVAHDFNNLLTTVLGNVDWLRGSSRMEPSHRAALDDVERSVRRGSALTRQLQALSRGSHGELVVEDVNTQIRGLLPVLGPMVGAGVQILASPCARPCPVKLVRGQTEQILLNLVINARDAMDGKGWIAIRTHCVQDAAGAERVQLVVADSGRGMDQATVSRIFEPFFSTKKGGMGTGLGMTSVWNIVEHSEGHIRVDSEVDNGTTITIDWPRTTIEEAVTDAAAGGPRARQSLRILLAEDDVAVRRSTMRTLVEGGHEVLAVHDGLAALEAVRRGQFDLLLTDVLMPHMEGTELAQQIRQQHPDVTVALMSGYIGPDQGRLQDLPLLPKPFTGKQLLEFVFAAQSAAAQRGLPSGP